MNNSIKVKPFFTTITKTGKQKVGIYVVDIPGRATLYYTETLSKVMDYIKGYQKQKTKTKTLSYITGFKDRLRDDKIFNNEIAI
ncbi:MAG TPA: hypothetical protein GXX63_12185 [Tissierellia bacterium]|nr:hypothetical protein [Tissierellia bacterium]